MGNQGEPSDFWSGIPRWPWMNIGGVVLMLFALAVAAYTVVTSGDRPLTQRELALFQITVLGTGLFGSLLVGRWSARMGAQEVVGQKARSAFRRALSIYKGLGRLRKSVRDRQGFLDSLADQAGTVSLVHVHAQLSVLSAQIIEQIGAADDALGDWRDLVPREIEDLERRAAAAGDVEEEGAEA